MLRHRTTVLAALAMAVTACSAPSQTATTATTASAPAAPSSGSGTSAVQAQLTKLGLAGKDVTQIVDALDRTKDDKPDTLRVSVRQREIVLTANGEETRMAMPADKTYVSLAPYTNRTHDCFNHNLATCQGEMVGQSFTVTIVDAAGKEVARTTQETYGNGFLGLWVPRGVTGTINVEGGGRRATAPFSSNDDAPTCLTTLKLT